jgi:hypothetical protein
MFMTVLEALKALAPLHGPKSAPSFPDRVARAGERSSKNVACSVARLRRRRTSRLPWRDVNVSGLSKHGWI